MSSSSGRSASASPAHLRATSTLHGVEGVLVAGVVVFLIVLLFGVIFVDVHFVEARCKGPRWVARTWRVAWDDEVVDGIVGSASLDSLDGVQESHVKFEAGS